MTSPEGIGTRRPVSGAHYGLFDWIAQRLTAIVMLVFVVLVLIGYLAGSSSGYTRWALLFAPLWMKSVTFVAVVALLYHAWVGMRDIWMDYIKRTLLRLMLELFTAVWLLGCAGYTLLTLWSV